MHELQVVNGILKIVLAHAQKNNVIKVVGIYLRIGEFSGLEEEWIQQYFDYLSKTTIAKGAKITIEWVPARMKCGVCSFEFNVNVKNLGEIRCPGCSEKKLQLISGREYCVQSVEVI